MPTLLYVLLSLLVGFVIGYFYCKERFMIKELISSNEILAEFVAGEINQEEALRRVKELTAPLNV